MDQEQFFQYSSPQIPSHDQNRTPLESKDENSGSQPRQIMTSNIKELYSSRDRLREFAKKIGLECNKSIRRDVIMHCNKIRLNWNQNLGYEKVQKMTKNRIQKMIKNKRIKKNWSEEDVLIFIWVVSKYSDYKGADNVERDLNAKDWQEIANLIPGVQAQNCMFKWLGLKKSNLSDNCWSDRESSLLDKIVKKLGDGDWSLIAQKLYYANTSSYKIYRCPKQCRQHWNCYLNPKLKKGPWSKQEDILLLSSVMKNNGQKRWAEIVKNFNGRTQNALKNRYTLIIDKQLKNLSKNQEISEIPQIEIIKQYLQRTYVQQFMDIKNQCENQSNLSQSKMKQIKKIKKNNSCNQTPRRQVRTSLRRRTSLKEPIIQENLENNPILNYCDFIHPKIQPDYSYPETPETMKSALKKSLENFDNSANFVFTQKSGSKKKTGRTLKRTLSIPAKLQQIYESQQNPVKIQEQLINYDNHQCLPYHMFQLKQNYVKEQMPIYQQSQHHSNFVNIYGDDDDFISHNFNHKSESKQRVCKIQQKDSLFHSFAEENYYDNNYYHHESSLNFHIFDPFHNDNEFAVENREQNDAFNHQKHKNMYETWDQLPKNQLSK